jgi:CheY-like chemotaxis protein
MSESRPSRPQEVVLIVDDDHAVRESVSGLLADEGFSPVGFADGVDALAAIRAGLKPSVILLDISMPRMDGWDFRNAQRGDPALKDLPVALITAAGFSEGTIRLQFGEIPLLRKPIRPAELLELVARLSGRGAAKGPTDDDLELTDARR